MYNTILFDLDGTLIDSGLGVTSAVWHALDKMGVEVKDRSELYRFIGPPLMDSFGKFCGFSEEQCEQAIEYYREYYRSKGVYENEVYDGIPEVVKTLKEMGKTLLVATSKPEPFAVAILKDIGLYDYFDVVQGASLDQSLIRKADIINVALEKCNNSDLSTMIMVGDREYDILGAKKIGMDSIGVLFGFGSREELEAAGATYIAEKPEDILKVV